MTSDEFSEIREAWAELKLCFEEEAACQAEAMGRGMGAAAAARSASVR